MAAALSALLLVFVLDLHTSATAYPGSVIDANIQIEGLGQDPPREFSGGDAATLGSSVALVGDIDGQGGSDFAAGAPAATDSRNNARAGIVEIYLSGDDSPSVVTIDLPTASGGELFGSALAPIGDIDSNGADDLIVGAYGDSAIYVVMLTNTASVVSRVRIDIQTVYNALSLAVLLRSDDFFGAAIATLQRSNSG